MAAHFVRLIVGQTALLFLSGLAIFTMVLYGPPDWGRLVSQIPGNLNCDTRGAGCIDYVIEARRSPFELDKHWPFNYAAYLFDPADTSEISLVSGAEIPKGIKIEVGPWSIEGSGVLTGDLGKSESVIHGWSADVTEVIGNGWWNLHVLLFALALLLMGIAMFQRRRRPTSIYASPVRLDAIGDNSDLARFRSGGW